MSKIDLLKPKVKKLAEQLLIECKKRGIDLTITQTLRTIEEQNKLYAIGKTKPGKIVTNSRGGYSFHNYGVAFDFCPVRSGRAIWNDIALFDAIGRLGVKLGLEWGGNWSKFKDRPHFQYTGGYSIKDYINKKIDWQRFEA